MRFMETGRGDRGLGARDNGGRNRALGGLEGFKWRNLEGVSAVGI